MSCQRKGLKKTFLLNEVTTGAQRSYFNGDGCVVYAMVDTGSFIFGNAGGVFEGFVRCLG